MEAEKLNEIKTITITMVDPYIAMLRPACVAENGEIIFGEGVSIYIDWNSRPHRECDYMLDGEDVSRIWVISDCEWVRYKNMEEFIYSGLR